MQMRVLKTSDVEMSTFSVPASMAEDDCTLRKYLYYFAEYCKYDRLLCFWVKLAGGRLRAYFRTNSGIESRTYSPIEVTEAIFYKKALFSHPAEEILSLLEEFPGPLRKELSKTSVEFTYASSGVLI